MIPAFAIFRFPCLAAWRSGQRINVCVDEFHSWCSPQFFQTTSKSKGCLYLPALCFSLLSSNTLLKLLLIRLNTQTPPPESRRLLVWAEEGQTGPLPLHRSRPVWCYRCREIGQQKPEMSSNKSHKGTSRFAVPVFLFFKQKLWKNPLWGLSSGRNLFFPDAPFNTMQTIVSDVT